MQVAGDDREEGGDEETIDTHQSETQRQHGNDEVFPASCQYVLRWTVHLGGPCRCARSRWAFRRRRRSSISCGDQVRKPTPDLNPSFPAATRSSSKGFGPESRLSSGM